VRPVLLYECQAWKINKTEKKRRDRFHFTCLSKILRTWWPKRVRNEAISEITGVNTISDEIRIRGWNWIGHVLRKERNNDCMVAMEWQPEGRRKPGRPLGEGQ